MRVVTAPHWPCSYWILRRVIFWGRVVTTRRNYAGHDADAFPLFLYLCHFIYNLAYLSSLILSLNELQSGFRKQHSTIKAVSIVTNDFIWTLDNKQHCRSVYWSIKGLTLYHWPISFIHHMCTNTGEKFEVNIGLLLQNKILAVFWGKETACQCHIFVRYGL